MKDGVDWFGRWEEVVEGEIGVGVVCDFVAAETEGTVGGARGEREVGFEEGGPWS